MFFSIIVAPAAFSVLDRDSAGRLVTTVFPRYYVFGMVLGLLSLAAVLGRVATAARGEAPWATLALVLLMVALTGYVLVVLLPVLESARTAMHAVGAKPESAVPEAGRFARLHQLSVILNGVTLLAGLVVVGLETFRARG